MRRGTRIAPGLIRHAGRLRSLQGSIVQACCADLTRTARNGGPAFLFYAVVGGFAGDDYIVNVAFAKTGGSDAHEFAALGEGFQVFGADVAHAAAQTADELIGEGGQGAFVRDAAFDALGHGFAALDFVFLGVAVGGAFFHGGGGAHAAIGLEGAALVENRFAGGFFGAGEKAANHDAGSSGGDGLGDVAGEFNAAVGDDGNAGAFGGARGFHDGGDLRDAGAGDHTRGADGAGSHTDFQAVDAESDEILCAVVGSDVAGDELHVWQAMANGFDGVHNARGMAVGGVDGDDVGFVLGHFDGALEKIAGGADGRADAQAALLIFCSARVFEFFLDVLYGDEAFEIEVLIDDEKFFDAMLLQKALRFVERGADGNGDEVILGHHGAYELIVIFFEAQVAVGEDAGEAGAARDRQAGDLVLVHDLEGLAEGDVGGDGDGVDDHAAFGALDAVDFFALAVDGHVFVHDADAALASDGDGQARFGDGVHGGGSERNVQGQLAGEAGARVGVGGENRGLARKQQNVVEREAFGDGTVNHCVLDLGLWAAAKDSGIAHKTTQPSGWPLGR